MREPLPPMVPLLCRRAYPPAGIAHHDHPVTAAAAMTPIVRILSPVPFKPLSTAWRGGVA